MLSAGWLGLACLQACSAGLQAGFRGVLTTSLAGQAGKSADQPADHQLGQVRRPG